MDDIRKYEPLFGSWTVDRVIGEGSFGKVYALKKMDFGREYYSALKVITIPQNKSEISGLRSEGLDDRSLREHFKQVVAEVVSEFDLMSRFRGNSNIVSYEDHMLIPSEDGFGYEILIRMELLISLVKILEQNAFSKKDVIQLGIDMCKALELCQKHDIIHRDIKPENIFVSSNGDYKLGDFGIARTVEKTGGEMSKKGTYTYMAPEVYRGDSYGSDVDIYSLGIVLYRLLNGNRTPFLPPYPAPITHSDRENALMRRISGAAIPPPSGAGGRLAEIVMKAIEYNPKDRFISPGQMRQELEAIAYSEGEGQIIYPSGDRVDLPPSQYAGGSAGQPGARSGEAGVATPPPPQGAPNPPQNAPYGEPSNNQQPAPPTGVQPPPPQGAPYPQQAAPYPPQGVPAAGVQPPPPQGAPYPPQAAPYPPQGAPAAGVQPPPPQAAPYPPQGAPYPPQGGAPYAGAPYAAPAAPIDFDATVADISAGAGGSLYPPAPAPAQPQAKGPPPWLKWAIIGGAAVIVIIILVIVLSSNSKKTTKDDDDLFDITTEDVEEDESDKKTENPPSPEDELHGNTPGNISNGGFIAQTEDWLFYKGDDTKLHRMRPDGSDNTVLSEDSCDYINVVGDWVYYSNASSNNRLYKIKTDGSERVGLNEDNCAYINVVEDWVYYSDVNDEGKLYKITVNGTEKTGLGDDSGICLNVAGGWVYYCNSSDGNKIYKIRDDGSGRSKVSDDSSESICVAGEWVYYRNDSDSYKLYKIRTNGNERTNLGDDRCNYVNAFGEWVYYTTWGDAALHKISMDGESTSKVSDSRAGEINVFGDWVYFYNWDSANKLYKIRTDGQQQATIDAQIEIQSQNGQQSQGPGESPPDSESPKPSDSPPQSESPKPSDSPPPSESPRPSDSPGASDSPKPGESQRPDQSGNVSSSVSEKIWEDFSTGNFISMMTETTYQVYNGVSIYLTEAGATMTDSGDLYIAVGIVITNNLGNDIIMEEQDFVCAAYSNNMFDDFKSADIVLDYNDQSLRYPVTVKSRDSMYLTLGFKIPVSSDMAIFAFSNIWGTDYKGSSYIYFISE